MPTITLSVVAGQTVTRNRTISGAHLTRMVAACKQIFGPQMTDEEAILAWADNLLLITRHQVRQAEDTAAIAAQTDIVLS